MNIAVHFKRRHKRFTVHLFCCTAVAACAQTPHKSGKKNTYETRNIYWILIDSDIDTMLRWSGFGSESVFQMSFEANGMNVYVCACIYAFVCVCENEDIIDAKHFLKRDYLFDSLRKIRVKIASNKLKWKPLIFKCKLTFQGKLTITFGILWHDDIFHDPPILCGVNMRAATIYWNGKFYELSTIWVGSVVQ